MNLYIIIIAALSFLCLYLLCSRSKISKITYTWLEDKERKGITTFKCITSWRIDGKEYAVLQYNPKEAAVGIHKIKTIIVKAHPAMTSLTPGYTYEVYKESTHSFDKTFKKYIFTAQR